MARIADEPQGASGWLQRQWAHVRARSAQASAAEPAGGRFPLPEQ